MEAPAPASRGGDWWPIATLWLLIAGWAAFFLIQNYHLRLVKRWGPAPDIVDALGRDHVIGRRIIPYYTAVLFLDGFALLSLTTQCRRDWPVVVKTLAGALLIPSILWHGFIWLVVVFFAI